MKIISTILAAVLCSSAPLLAKEEADKKTTVQPALIQQKLGKEAVAELRKAYENGEYDSFLSEVDASYETLKENHKIDELASLRTQQVIDQRWIDAVIPLQIEKNQKLLEHVADQNSPFAEKVKSAATDILTPDQHQALRNLAKIRDMAPGQGKNADENRLIDLDLEYEYKALHVGIPAMDPFAQTDTKSQQFVLKMEMMDKLLALSESFEDAQLKESVRIASQNFDQQLAQKWDQMDLSALAKGKIESQNTIEEKVATTLQIHVEKLQDLSHVLFNGDKETHAVQQ